MHHEKANFPEPRAGGFFKLRGTAIILGEDGLAGIKLNLSRSHASAWERHVATLRVAEAKHTVA